MIQATLWSYKTQACVFYDLLKIPCRITYPKELVELHTLQGFVNLVFPRNCLHEIFSLDQSKIHERDFRYATGS